MAERMGFEPMKEFPLYTLSKPAPKPLGLLVFIILAYFFLKFQDLNLVTTIRRQDYLAFFDFLRISKNCFKYVSSNLNLFFDLYFFNIF